MREVSESGDDSIFANRAAELQVEVTIVKKFKN